jgi:hypothetical protein
MIHVYAIRAHDVDQDEIHLVRWRNPDTGTRGELPMNDLINWLDLGGYAYAVVDGDLRRLSLDSMSAAGGRETARLDGLRALPQF